MMRRFTFTGIARASLLASVVLLPCSPPSFARCPGCMVVIDSTSQGHVSNPTPNVTKPDVIATDSYTTDCAPGQILTQVPGESTVKCIDTIAKAQGTTGLACNSGNVLTGNGEFACTDTIKYATAAAGAGSAPNQPLQCGSNQFIQSDAAGTFYCADYGASTCSYAGTTYSIGQSYSLPVGPNACAGLNALYTGTYTYTGSQTCIASGSGAAWSAVVKSNYSGTCIEPCTDVPGFAGYGGNATETMLANGTFGPWNTSACVAGCTDPHGTFHPVDAAPWPNAWLQADTYATPSNETCNYMAINNPTAVTDGTGGKPFSTYIGDTTHYPTIAAIDEYVCYMVSGVPTIWPGPDDGTYQAQFATKSIGTHVTNQGWSGTGQTTNIDNRWNASSCVQQPTCTDGYGTHLDTSSWACGTTPLTQACPAGDTGTETGTNSKTCTCNAGSITSTTTFSGWNTSACTLPGCTDSSGLFHANGSTWTTTSPLSRACGAGQYGSGQTGTATTTYQCTSGTIVNEGTTDAWNAGSCTVIGSACGGPYVCPSPLTYNGVEVGTTGGMLNNEYFECAAGGGYLYQCTKLRGSTGWSLSCDSNPNGC